MKLSLRYTRLLFLIALAPLLFAGCAVSEANCANSSEASGKTYVEPGVFARDWRLYTLEEDGVALSVPPGWKEFNLSEQDLQTVMNEMAAANPQFGSAMGSQVASMASQGVKFYAFDLWSASLQMGFANNINLLKVDKPCDVTLDKAVKESIAELEEQLSGTLDGPILSARLTTVGGEQVRRINYDAVLNMPDGSPLAISLVQYMLVDDNSLYILTGTTTTSQITDYALTFEQIAQSIYLLR
jgi:hypothetical protein